jgi:ABC-type amino acid transport substrate-binding protein
MRNLRRPLVECVDLALREMKDDGTLEGIRREWLGNGANVALIEA